MSLYLAAYDVSNDRQREKIARVLTKYGSRLQWSVFEVWLDPDDFPTFRREIGSLLGKSDAFDLLPIDERPARTRLRWQRPLEQRGAVVVLE
jgi:CRISPR-associated protein Cas2